MTSNTCILGKWGAAAPWLSFDHSLIKLNIPKTLYVEQPWFIDLNEYRKNPCLKPCILDKELGLRVSNVNSIETWLESGIRPHFNPSLTWTSKLRKIAYKAQKYKSALDANMLQGIVHMPQEVFTLREDRPNRTVVVLDIKSAYASLVRDISMPDPAKLRYVDSRTVHQAWIDPELRGLFRVSISLKDNAPEWFKEYHPLIHAENCVTTPFKFMHGDVCVTWMHSLEKTYWEPYLNITPLDGIVAPTYAHPLAKLSNTLLELKKNNKCPYKDAQLKWLLSRIHSAAVPKVLRCASKEQADTWFKTIGSVPTIKHNQIPLSNGSWLLPDVHNVNIVYTWSSTISGAMRAKWLGMLTELYSICSDIQVCYANVDSLHISVPSSEWASIADSLHERSICGVEPGQWAIKTIGTSGLWLSTDKYWIFNNQKLVKCTSLGENWKLKDSMFVVKSGKIKKLKRSLWSSLSSKKDTKLINRRLILQKRRTLLVLQNKTESIRAWRKETLLSRNWKKKIWYRTRNRHGKEK